MLKLKLQYFGHLMWRADSLEKTLMLEGLGAGGKVDDREWDGWMASPTRWAWVWVNSRSWWWTGRPGVLWFMGSQRVGHDCSYFYALFHFKTDLRYPCVHAVLLQSCLTLCNPMDRGPPGSSVQGILQARILEWVAMPSYRESSRPRDWTCISYISCIGRWVLYY